MRVSLNLFDGMCFRQFSTRSLFFHFSCILLYHHYPVGNWLFTCTFSSIENHFLPIICIYKRTFSQISNVCPLSIKRNRNALTRPQLVVQLLPRHWHLVSNFLPKHFLGSLSLFLWSNPHRCLIQLAKKFSDIDTHIASSTSHSSAPYDVTLSPTECFCNLLLSNNIRSISHRQGDHSNYDFSHWTVKTSEHQIPSLIT